MYYPFGAGQGRLRWAKPILPHHFFEMKKTEQDKVSHGE